MRNSSGVRGTGPVYFTNPHGDFQRTSIGKSLTFRRAAPEHLERGRRREEREAAPPNVRIAPALVSIRSFVSSGAATSAAGLVQTNPLLAFTSFRILLLKAVENRRFVAGIVVETAQRENAISVGQKMMHLDLAANENALVLRQ